MLHRTHNLVVMILFVFVSLLISSCTGTAGDSGASDTGLPSGYYITGTGSTTLSWEAPTQNTDDTPVGTLNGFVIYFGPASGTLAYSVYVDDENATMYTVQNLRENVTYMFAITAVNADGVESDLSNIVNKIITQ